MKKILKTHTEQEFMMILKSDTGLEHLDVPVGTVIVSCSYNQLTHIDLPEGVYTLWGRHNLFKELTLPKSLTWLECDKELFDYDKCEVENVSIYYT